MTGFDLVDEDILRPAELTGHADVEFAFERIGAPFKNDKIVAPANFSHHWCEFFG